MDLKSEKIEKILSKYRFHDVAVEELHKIHHVYPDMKLLTGTYRRSYNFPVQLWFMDSFPFTPPICLLRPTASMAVREGRHVDAQGRVHLPGLHNWDYEPPLSSKGGVEAEDPLKLLASISSIQNEGGAQHHNKTINKVSVIGGGDLGMATIMSILAKTYASVVQTNVDMYRGIIPTLAHLSPNAVMLIASQPVDLMTHVAWRQSGLPPTHVMGAGCNLDSERLCQVLDTDLNTHKQAWRLQIAPSSSASKPLLERALDMMKNRGQRSWSVGLSLADITHTVLTGRSKVHSITTLAQGWGGITSEVFLSLPCLLGSNGSMRLAGTTLGAEDSGKLQAS
ncbi:hypothetical protein CRUP_018373, partial [Coryphaenoides rupestris]